MFRDEQRGRVRPVAVGVAVLLVLAGVTILVIGLRAPERPPQPSASAAAGPPVVAGPLSPAPPGEERSEQQGTAAAMEPLPAAVPVELEIPAIDVRSELMTLGLNPDDTVEVPPLSQDAPAGWYRYSPTPGELGPAVILGHVDSAEYGPGVFFELGALEPRDTVSVTREDRSTAVFVVERVVSYPKADFPTAEVYGNTDRPALRLITCGGAFDDRTRSYLDNVVVYASLIEIRST